MTPIPITIKTSLDLAMWGTIGLGVGLLRQTWSGFWFAIGALMAARWAGVVGLVGLLALPSLAAAQTLQSPNPRLTGQLPGCRWTTFLGEGLIGPDHLPYVILLNPFGPQLAEVTLFDNAGNSPTFLLDVPRGRSEHIWSHPRRPWLTTMVAWSAIIRWEIGGSAHLTSWRVPMPMGRVSEWRVELVSPSWYVHVCE